ncbi:MAG: hypothetical protein AAF089_06295 [Bacteroidota bacterium]
MNDTPTPSAPDALPSEPSNAPVITAPRWDWRPKLRWFAAEYLIVVLGVLTAVGLNAWWQGRTDRAQEQVYLRQLDADLDESLRVFARADSIQEAVSTPALLTVLGSWGSGTPLPADSIVHHSRRMFTWRAVQPTTGTAEALVATGDLTLIRNDSLRNAITAYLGATETLVGFQARVAEQYNDAIARYIPAVGANRVAAVDLGMDLGMDLLQRSISESKLLTDDGWAPPFPLDSFSFYASQEAYDALSEIALYRQTSFNIMAAMSQETQDLHERVEAELNR